MNKKVPEDQKRRGRIERQRKYMARKRAADPDGVKKKQNAAVRKYAKKYPARAKAATKKWRAENRGRVNAARRVWRARNQVRALWLEARHRAKRRGVEFTIWLDDIPPMGPCCPLLGHPFPFPGSRTAFSPSLDRRDPTKGYVPGNIWIVGYRANLIKNDGTAAEHEMIAAAMRRWGVG